MKSENKPFIHIKQFLTIVDELLESADGGAMVTLEKVNVIRYSAGKSDV